MMNRNNNNTYNEDDEKTSKPYDQKIKRESPEEVTMREQKDMKAALAIMNQLESLIEIDDNQ